MTDTMVADLEEIANEIDDIAAANEEQAAQIQEVSDTVDKLTQ